MIPIKQKFVLFLCTLLFCSAATPVALATSQDDNAAGIAFKVTYTDNRYRVFMRSEATPSAHSLTLTAQVTLKVPHGINADRFVVDDIQSPLAGATWRVTSRIDAPVEDPNADYVSFTVDFPGGNHQVYQWLAGQEIQMFSLNNRGTCLGTIALLENNDPFMTPVNSANTNPGNQIDVIGLGEGNLYIGTYSGPANCDDVTSTSAPPKIFLPVITR